MILNSYRIIDDSARALDQTKEFLESWQQGKGSYWVDIQAYEPDELEAWLSTFHLPAFFTQFFHSSGQTTRFIQLPDAVFFEFPVNTGDVTSEIGHLSFLCMQNLLVTMHHAPLEGLDNLIKELTTEVPLLPPTTSALLCLLSMSESAMSLRRSETLKKAVFNLDKRIDDDPESVTADEILDSKRSLLTLDTVVRGQIRCFELMSGLNSPSLDLMELTRQFQMAPSNASAANQNVEQLEKVLTEIRLRFGMGQQDKTNRRLAILTILSAIFMPLTFISGIYGMNFDTMPELHFSFGYPLVLISMVLIAGGMYLFFKTKGWFD